MKLSPSETGLVVNKALFYLLRANASSTSMEDINATTNHPLLISFYLYQGKSMHIYSPKTFTS